MVRRKNRFMIRLSDEEKKTYDALRVRLRHEEWSAFMRECLRRVFELETAQRPITLPDVEKEKEFPLVDLKKKPRKAATKKPAKKRGKLAVAV